MSGTVLKSVTLLQISEGIGLSLCYKRPMLCVLFVCNCVIQVKGTTGWFLEVLVYGGAAGGGGGGVKGGDN